MAGSKVALVTGGARGIGRAVCKRLAADGNIVFVNFARDQAAADATVAEITERGGKAFAVQGDITDLAANRSLFEGVIGQTGRLDILVNSAGVGATGSFDSLDEATYDRLFTITKGTYFLLQNAMKHVADHGRIINLSTGLTRSWAFRAAAYAGSKAAIEQFTRSLSKEVGPRGITVNAVLPGVTQTDMTSGFPAAHLDAARQQTSLGRLGQPEDIADIVAFLASEDARWVTGQLIVANGGSTP